MVQGTVLQASAPILKDFFLDSHHVHIQGRPINMIQLFWGKLNFLHAEKKVEKIK